jgi:hypothetical protein
VPSSLSFLGNVASARARLRFNRNGAPVTDPSGHGDYAEAMRELIAELRPLARGAVLSADNTREPSRGCRGHLRLVR